MSAQDAREIAARHRRFGRKIEHLGHAQAGSCGGQQGFAATESVAALSEALRRTGGNPTRTAQPLGEVGRGAARDPVGTVRAMMRRLGITSGTQP